MISSSYYFEKSSPEIGISVQPDMSLSSLLSCLWTLDLSPQTLGDFLDPGSLSLGVGKHLSKRFDGDGDSHFFRRISLSGEHLPCHEVGLLAMFEPEKAMSLGMFLDREMD